MIPVKCIRVSLEIFPFAKLSRIDENRDDDSFRMLTSQFDQTQVAFMQIPHRRHECNVIARATPVIELVT